MKLPWRARLSTARQQSALRRRQLTTMARTYADAIASLNTLQSNFAVVDAIRKSGRSLNQQAIPEMIEWCEKVGYKVRFQDVL